MTEKPKNTLRLFLEELAFENPAPEERWLRRDTWDPMFPLSLIDVAKKKGLVETRGDRHSEDFAYRFLPAGRDALSSVESGDS